MRELLEANYVFAETTATKAELLKYRVESNSVLSFANEFCQFGDKLAVFKDDLYQRYKEYCFTVGGKPVSQTIFNRELSANYPPITEGRDTLTKRRVWRNIAYNEAGNDRGFEG
jgi:putative DNA primase/helicase